MTSRMHVRVKTSLLLHKGYLICTHLEDTPSHQGLRRSKSMNIFKTVRVLTEFWNKSYFSYFKCARNVHTV